VVTIQKRGTYTDVMPHAKKKEDREFQGITRLLDIEISQQKERNSERQKEIQI